jgi:hypothetical protein
MDRVCEAHPDRPQTEHFIGLSSASAFPNGVVFPIRIKLANDVSVQCPHDADAKRMPHKLKKCDRIAASNLSQDQGSVRREAVHIRPSRLGLRKLCGLNGGFP